MTFAELPEMKLTEEGTEPVASVLVSAGVLIICSFRLLIFSSCSNLTAAM